MVDEAIDLYFDTKKLTESDIVKNGNACLTQSPLRMLESSVLEYRTSQNNTYLYSCTSQSITQMELEYIRLRTWINEIENLKCKQELSQILFPIFSHLYLDTFYESNNAQSQSAMIFFKRHQSFFTSESLRDIIKDIGNICRKEEIDSKPLVKTFRSAKFELKLSPMSGTLLKNYIANCDEPTILLNVLSSWFVIEDDDHNVREDDDPAVCPESEIIMGQRIEDNSSPTKLIPEEIISNNSDSDTDVCDDQLDQSDTVKQWTSSFKNLRNSVPHVSPLLLLQVHNSQNVSSASVCYQSKVLTLGHLDSEIKVLSFSEDQGILSENKCLPIKLNVTNSDNAENINSLKDSWTLRGHSASVSAVKFLQNPDIVLSSSHDTTLRAWKKEDFSCTAVYKGHNSPIWNFDVSSLNLYVATGSQDKTAKLWTLDKTYPLRVYVGHYNSVTCVKFHPNGLYLATASSDKTVRLFSVIDGKIARLFVGHSGPVHTLAFSPDGQYLASAGDCNEVMVWNLALGQPYLSLNTKSQYISDLSWNLDSSVLAITFLNQFIRLIHIRKKTKESQHEIIGKYELPDHRLMYCQFLERNNLVAVGVL